MMERKAYMFQRRSAVYERGCAKHWPGWLKCSRKAVTLALVTLLIIAPALAACAKVNPASDPGTEQGDPGTAGSPNTSSLPNTSISSDDMFTDRDVDTSYKDPKYVEIALSDSGITAASANVKVNGSVATIIDEGTYVLSGTLSDGQIVVDAQNSDKVQLVLGGVSINRNYGAAIYVKQADKVFITLKDGTTNTLSTTGEYVAIDENNIDSVIFSKDDLTFNGSGTLSLTSAFGHGIVSKDDLVFAGGTYRIVSAGHGVQAKDSVRIAAGDFTISAGRDGIHAENADDPSLGFIYVVDGKFDITAETDGFDAAAYLQVKGGTFAITAGGGSVNASMGASGEQMPEWGRWGQGSGQEPRLVPEQQEPGQTVGQTPGKVSGQAPGQSPGQAAGGASPNTETASSSAKGLKTDGSLLIESGTFIIDSSDDSLHSNSNIVISNGSFTIASGDDGMHADTNVAISGGTIEISKSYEGIEGQSIDIKGGTISLVATDDGLNAAGGADGSGMGGRPGMGNFNASADCYIAISGGKVLIDASGDGVDSNGNLFVSGGETYVSGPTNSGNGALDYGGTAKITGGVFVAVGSSGMAQNFGSDSTQGAILYNTQATQSAGSTVILKDQAGNVIASYTPQKQYSSVVMSAPGIKQGATYSLMVGSTSQTITMSSLIYGEGVGGFGGQGGRQPTKPW